MKYVLLRYKAILNAVAGPVLLSRRTSLGWKDMEERNVGNGNVSA